MGVSDFYECKSMSSIIHTWVDLKFGFPASEQDGSDRGWLPLSHLVPTSAEKTEPQDRLEAEA